jgi:hypothetical protein
MRCLAIVPYHLHHTLASHTTIFWPRLQNGSVNQPRHFCKGCQRYWTAGGTLRNVPVGSGRRKSKSAAAVTAGAAGGISGGVKLEGAVGGGSGAVGLANGYHTPPSTAAGATLDKHGSTTAAAGLAHYQHAAAAAMHHLPATLGGLPLAVSGSGHAADAMSAAAQQLMAATTYPYSVSHRLDAIGVPLLGLSGLLGLF